MALVRAWRYVDAIQNVSLESLREAGITCVLFDRDNTVVPRSTRRAPEEVLAWFDQLKAAGIECCMVSNNFHTSQVQASARELGVDAIDHALKPLPFAIHRALGRKGFDPGRTVMVGDQVFTDVVAGNLAGVKTILVRPQSRRDLWYTHILRVFEALVLRGKSFEGE